MIDPYTHVEDQIDREICKKAIKKYIRCKNIISENDPKKEEKEIKGKIMKEIFKYFKQGLTSSEMREKILYKNQKTPESWGKRYFSTYRQFMRFIKSLKVKPKPNLDHVLSTFKNHLSEILENYKDTIKTMHPTVEYQWLEKLIWVDKLVQKMRPYVEDILPKDEEKTDNKSKKKAKREKTKTKENNIQENGEEKENTYDYVKNMDIPKEIQKIIYDNYKEIILDEKEKNSFLENCRKEGIIPTIRRKIKKDLRRTILKEGRNIEYYENIDYENVYYSPDVLRYKKWLCIHAEKILEMIEEKIKEDELRINAKEMGKVQMDKAVREQYRQYFKLQSGKPKGPNDVQQN